MDNETDIEMLQKYGPAPDRWWWCLWIYPPEFPGQKADLVHEQNAEWDEEVRAANESLQREHELEVAYLNGDDAPAQPSLFLI